MKARKLAARTDTTTPIFDARRLRDELDHPHPMRQAAAYAAARAVLALAEDRFTLLEGTRAEVWAHVLDATRLQADVARGRATRERPADPMRAVGAQLVLDTIARVLALRSSAESTDELPSELVDPADLGRARDRLDAWMREHDRARHAA
jgi:hypothetical protein